MKIFRAQNKSLQLIVPPHVERIWDSYLIVAKNNLGYELSTQIASPIKFNKVLNTSNGELNRPPVKQSTTKSVITIHPTPLEKPHLLDDRLPSKRKPSGRRIPSPSPSSLTTTPRESPTTSPNQPRRFTEHDFDERSTTSESPSPCPSPSCSSPALPLHSALALASSSAPISASSSAPGSAPVSASASRDGIKRTKTAERFTESIICNMQSQTTLSSASLWSTQASHYVVHQDVLYTLHATSGSSTQSLSKWSSFNTSSLLSSDIPQCSFFLVWNSTFIFIGTDQIFFYSSEGKIEKTLDDKRIKHVIYASIYKDILLVVCERKFCTVDLVEKKIIGEGQSAFRSPYTSVKQSGPFYFVISKNFVQTLFVGESNHPWLQPHIVPLSSQELMPSFSQFMSEIEQPGGEQLLQVFLRRLLGPPSKVELLVELQKQLKNPVLTPEIMILLKKHGFNDEVSDTNLTAHQSLTALYNNILKDVRRDEWMNFISQEDFVEEYFSTKGMTLMEAKTSHFIQKIKQSPIFCTFPVSIPLVSVVASPSHIVTLNEDGAITLYYPDGTIFRELTRFTAPMPHSLFSQSELLIAASYDKVTIWHCSDISQTAPIDQLSSEHTIQEPRLIAEQLLWISDSKIIKTPIPTQKFLKIHMKQKFSRVRRSFGGQVFQEFKKVVTNSETKSKWMEKVEELMRLNYPEIADISQSCTITDPNQPDNPIIYVNDQFVAMTGYPRDEIVGKNCRFLQGPFSDSGPVIELSRNIRERKPTYIELLNYTKSGTPFWNNFCCLPVKNLKGKLVAFVAVQNDITEIKLDGDYRYWKPEEVALWISSIGYPAFSPLFIGAKISGIALTKMKPKQLRDIGIPNDKVEAFCSALSQQLNLRSQAQESRRASNDPTVVKILQRIQLDVPDAPVFDAPAPVSEHVLAPEKKIVSLEPVISQRHDRTIIRAPCPTTEKIEEMECRIESSFLIDPKTLTSLEPLSYIGTPKDPKNFTWVKFLVHVLKMGSSIMIFEHSSSRVVVHAGSSHLLKKNGQLDKRKTAGFLGQMFKAVFKLLPKIPECIEALSQFTTTNYSALPQLSIGVVYVSKGTTSRKDAFFNKTTSPAFDQLLDGLNKKARQKQVHWVKNKKIYSATQLTESDQRRFVGNCIFAVIYHDSDTPFDASLFKLGGVTSFIAVVQPSNQHYRLHFYWNISTADEEKPNTLQKKLAKIQIQPTVPQNYVFDLPKTCDLIMTKFHNAIIHLATYHPVFARLVAKVMNNAITDLESSFV